MIFLISLLKLGLIWLPSYWLCSQSVSVRGVGRATFLVGLSGIVSMLLVGSVMWLLLITTAKILPWIAIALVIVFCVVLGLMIQQIRGDGSVPIAQDMKDHQARQSSQTPMLTVFTWLITLLIIIRLGTWLPDVLLRPVFGWDAWTVWAYEARVWLEQGRYVPFLDPTQNLVASRDEWVRSNVVTYPRLIPALILWVASAGEAWTGVGPGLLWWMVCAYSALMLAGTMRLLGHSWIWGILLAYFWISLPMVSAHASLYGYADLWLGAVLGAFACLMVLAEHSQSRTLVWSSVLILLFLPLIKVEGLYWLGICLFSMLLRFHWVGLRTLVGLAVLAIGSVLVVKVAGFDLIHWVTAERLSLEFGDMKRAMVGGIRHAFYWYDWHVLFYAFFAALIFALIRPMMIIKFRAITSMCLLGLILIGLFLPMTGAGDWLDQGTLFSRVALQLSMVLVIFSLLTINQFWAEERRG